jgi:hypothetical protein
MPGKLPQRPILLRLMPTCLPPVVRNSGLEVVHDLLLQRCLGVLVDFVEEIFLIKTIK